MWNRILEYIRRLRNSRPIRWLLGEKTDRPTETVTQPEDVSSQSPAEPKTKTELFTTYPEIDWGNDPPQYRKRSVLSYREREFYRFLHSLFGKEYHILAMVRMGDVLWLANETSNRKFFNNQILCKHLDYVLCDRLKFEPILAIELDDNRHHWYNRWRVDEFKNKACEIADLPLLRVKVQEKYDRTEIGQKIRRKIEMATET